MKKDRMDETFDRLWERAVSQSETSEPGIVPDPEMSWLRMRRELEKERRMKRRRRSVKWVSLAAASLGVGAFLFHSLQTTEAFRTMYDIVHKAAGGTVSIQINSREKPDASGALTAPPPPDGGPEAPRPDNRDLPEENSIRKTVAQEEAYRESQFTLPLLGYIPDGYELKESVVHYSLGETKGSAVRFIYERADRPKPLKIVFRKRTFSANADLPDGKRSLTETADGARILEWNEREMNIVLQGQIGEAELNKIADGMSPETK
ncbi:hypothetical protein [Paenibacillus hamazuiensis]|uniref:hypothetical protein n=1 Tax=Paenibacillus hamazuiensis TaxID=2936508 RepID=UPI00200C1BFD|nr:hypothetical protein [Paenibacillus hamazuiensis]